VVALPGDGAAERLHGLRQPVLAVCGHAEDVSDHLKWQGAGKRRDQVDRPFRRHRADERVDPRRDLCAIPLDTPGGEQAGEVRADGAVAPGREPGHEP
jgi:hypothetical protein